MMKTAARFLLPLLVFSCICVVLSVKEWKNYENGKVHSHRKVNYKRLEEKQDTFVESDEQHLLHGHHGDKAEHHTEHNMKQPAASKRGDVASAKKEALQNRKNGIKHNKITSRANLKSLTTPEFHKSNLDDEEHQVPKHGSLMAQQIKRKNLTSSKALKSKQDKRKDPEERKHTKNNHTLLRSVTPKNHKNKGYKKNHPKSKGHVYGNSKAKSLFNNFQYHESKSKKEFVKNEFKIPPPPSYSTVW